LDRFFSQDIAAAPPEIIEAILNEFSCQSLRELLACKQSPASVLDAADSILASRMVNCAPMVALLQSTELIGLFTLRALNIDLLSALMKRQADVVLEVCLQLEGDLEMAATAARKTLNIRKLFEERVHGATKLPFKP
jgi:hypothetical protein